MIIFLTGMMGSGKSSQGVKLAKALNYQFLDTDQFIEASQNVKISDLFISHSEAFFRQIEHQILKDLSPLKNMVIATGGGFPCFGGNMELMNLLGFTIYLKADAAFLASRLENHQSERPLIAQLSGDNLDNYLNDLLKKRETYYLTSKLTMEARNLKTQHLIEALQKEGVL
jgi:shikimate kinase